MTDDNIMPYEILKASLDEAVADMNAKSTILLDTIHRQDPPLYIAIALHNFNASYAVVTARSSAVISEYGHLAGVTQRIQNQRDEVNRKLASMKKTVNQLKKLNLDDEDDMGEAKKDQNNPDAPNDKNKGKGRKK